jgi:hypothetical protein
VRTGQSGVGQSIAPTADAKKAIHFWPVPTRIAQTMRERNPGRQMPWVRAPMTIGNGMDKRAGLLVSERITHGVARVRYLHFTACHVEAGHHRILQVNDVTHAPIDDSAG